MNIDKGNQSNGGLSMVVLGHVAHPDVTGEEYRIKPLDSSPVPVIADTAGKLWLIVGSDSGFEGLSNLLLRPNRLHADAGHGGSEISPRCRVKPNRFDEPRR